MWETEDNIPKRLKDRIIATIEWLSYTEPVIVLNKL